MTSRELKDMRTHSGMTQGDLARLVGVHPMTVSRWERGVSPITPENQVAVEFAMWFSAMHPIRLHSFARSFGIDEPEPIQTLIRLAFVLCQEAGLIAREKAN